MDTPSDAPPLSLKAATLESHTIPWKVPPDILCFPYLRLLKSTTFFVYHFVRLKFPPEIEILVLVIVGSSNRFIDTNYCSTSIECSFHFQMDAFRIAEVIKIAGLSTFDEHMRSST